MPKKAIEDGEKTVAINIRLTEKLRDEIKILAVDDHRSLVQEIRWLLEKAVLSYKNELAQRELDQREFDQKILDQKARKQANR